MIRRSDDETDFGRRTDRLAHTRAKGLAGGKRGAEEEEAEEEWWLYLRISSSPLLGSVHALAKGCRESRKRYRES